ncbi:hypothetical protein IAT38_005825 [Cryptococcus sp. DSM 104549]
MSAASSRFPHPNSIASSHTGCTTCGFDHECTSEAPVIAYAVIYRGRLYRLENPFKAYIKCKSYLNPKGVV